MENPVKAFTKGFSSSYEMERRKKASPDPNRGAQFGGTPVASFLRGYTGGVGATAKSLKRSLLEPSYNPKR